MTFNSVYEILDPISTIRKQRFWDWFDGDDLRSFWTKRNNQGTGTFAMQDAIDAGFRITTGSSNGDQSRIDFNNIRHYNHNGAVCVFVCRSENTNRSQLNCGFVGVVDLFPVEMVFMGNDHFDSFYRLITGDGVQNNTDTDVATDALFHSHRIEVDGTDATLFIDGVLKVTKQANIPDVKMQPILRIRVSQNGPKFTEIRYFEAYNT